MISHFFFIGRGIFLTLQLLMGGLFLGFCLGTFMAIGRYKKIGSFFWDRLISVIRGTPVILQLSFFYFSIPALLNIKLSITAVGILTFGLNSSAYIAEILRSGIENLSKGQFEAAETLKIPPFYRWKDIILPQVLRNISPALVNEVISLLKETALISTFGGMDIMQSAKALAAEQFTYFMPLCIAGIYYYALVLIIEWMGKKIVSMYALR